MGKVCATAQERVVNGMVIVKSALNIIKAEKVDTSHIVKDQRNHYFLFLVKGNNEVIGKRKMIS
ncbi:MAG: hypothetical protein Q8942_10215 [Bacillota bacterium]|nr:hypothetical protein [Bacillota bacterium]